MTLVSLPTVHTLMPFAPFFVSWGDWSWLNVLVLDVVFAFAFLSFFPLPVSASYKELFFSSFLFPLLSLLVSFTLHIHIERDTHSLRRKKRHDEPEKPSEKDNQKLAFFPFLSLCVVFAIHSFIPIQPFFPSHPFFFTSTHPFIFLFQSSLCWTSFSFLHSLPFSLFPPIRNGHCMARHGIVLYLCLFVPLFLVLWVCEWRVWI